MKVVKNEKVFPVDVDDTLIIWDDYFEVPMRDRVECKDPYDGSVHYLKPHDAHIRLLKEKKERGCFVIVWSAGGFAWANAVIEALSLSDFVDLVMTKPSVYMDDLPVSEWMRDRIYIKPTSKWKNLKEK